MITNGIEIRCDADYSKLKVSPELRSLIRAVHANTGSPAYEMRYAHPWPERRSSAAPQRSESSFYRPADEISRERLRLKLAVLQRMR